MPTDEKETDPHPRGPSRFVGKTVSFDAPQAGKTDRRLRGTIESARYIGRTARGAIPDYEIKVRGNSGKTMTISLVESYASIQEDQR